MTNVKGYKTEELLNKVINLPSFEGIPTNYWVLGVASNEDARDKFDDKFYLFKGNQFILVTSGTTNKGDKGTAVLLTENWTYDCYMPSNGKNIRHHRDKMPCLRQVKGIPYRRDYTKDGKTNPTTEIFNNNISTNFHACTYDLTSKIIKQNIGGWSEGCLVVNDIPKYVKILELTQELNKPVSLCLINEF